jgi:O-antigen ligase
MRQESESTRTARLLFALLVCLSLLTAASSFWGSDWIAPYLVLGFAFALGCVWMVRVERDWWIAMFSLGGAEVMVALALFHRGKGEFETQVASHVRGEMTGDPNYMSFLIGLAITTAWCVAMQGCSYLKSKRRLAAGVRVLAILSTAGGLYILVHFQSRGLSAAVVGALLASMLHSRKGFKPLLVGGLAAGLILVVVSQTPAFEGLMRRWSNQNEISDGNLRFQLWKWVFEQWQGGPLFNQLLGFGSAAEIEKAGVFFSNVGKSHYVSTHNTFVGVFFEQGIVGVALLLGVLGLCAHRAWCRKDDVGNLRFSLLAFLALAGLSIEPQHDPVFWISLGLCLPIERADWVQPRIRPPSAYWWCARRSSFKGRVQPIVGRVQTRTSRRSVPSRGPFWRSRLAAARASRKARCLRCPRKLSY